METVKSHLISHVKLSTQSRYNKLVEIKAPQVVLDHTLDTLNNLSEDSFNKFFSVDKSSTDCLDWEYISKELKKGNGGKEYWIITCKEGLVNYFPAARFGRYIVKAKV